MPKQRRTYEGAEFVPIAELARRLAIGERRARTFVQQGLLPAPSPIGTVPRWHWPSVVTFIQKQGNPATGNPGEVFEDDIAAAITARVKKATADVA